MHQAHQPAVPDDLQERQVNHQLLCPQIGIDCQRGQQHDGDAHQHHIRKPVSAVEIGHRIDHHRRDYADRHAGDQTPLPLTPQHLDISLPPSPGISPVGHQRRIIHGRIKGCRHKAAEKPGKQQYLRAIPHGSQGEARQRRKHCQDAQQVGEKEPRNVVHDGPPGVPAGCAVLLIRIQRPAEFVVVQAAEHCHAIASFPQTFVLSVSYLSPLRYAMHSLRINLQVMRIIGHRPDNRNKRGRFPAESAPSSTFIPP